MNIQKKGGAVQWIVNTLARKGFKAYIVGGAVRDILAQQDPGDVDLLTNAPANTLQILFPRARQVGKSFPVCLVDGVEVASCRAANGPDSFPLSDLAMRDFTINSMAWNPLTDELVDPHGGQKDLENKCIRFTRDPIQRIKEDPLRMIRACRFAARFGAALSEESLQAILTLGHLIQATAPERIQGELIKAMALAAPSLFFRHLQAAGLLAGILPSLDRCFDLEGGPYHGETVFDHCMLVGDALSPVRPLLRLGGFVHDTGKFDAAGIKEGRLTYAGHETCTQAVETDLERLRFPSRHIAYILSLIQTHMRPLNEKTTPRSVRRLLALLNRHGLPFQDFFRLRIADMKGNLAKRPYTLSDIRLRLTKVLDQLSSTAAFNVNDLEISGRDIMALLDLPPGPPVGRIKEILFEKVLEEPGLNTRSRLEQEVFSLNPGENYKKQGQES